jgi:hypothetical protein
LCREIKPGSHGLYDCLRDSASPPAEGRDTYTFSVVEDEWVDSDVEVLLVKDKYWTSLIKYHKEPLAAVGIII